MIYRRIFTLLTLIIIFLLHYTKTNCQVSFDKHSNYYFLEIYYPELFQDTCLYFPELIFTSGGVRPYPRYAQIEIKKQDKKTNNDKKYEKAIENDTISRKNRIVSIQEADRGDKMAIYLEIENPDKEIKIIVYNLLGKKVLDIFEGKPKPSTQPYEFSVSELPKGIFLLVVVGDNFRLREKLVITK